MLKNHRRSLLHAAALLAAVAFVFLAVGRHPAWQPPRTTLPFVGDLDLMTLHAADDIRNGPMTLLARFLNVLGGGVVTIPLRFAVTAWLAVRRRWRALGTWVLAWIGAELVLAGAKAYMARGRPPGSLVETIGFSFPSGHAVAASAIAVTLVLVLLPSGSRRRKWELAAAAFAFVMALSRVYLNAHWLSDVVAGVLLGSAVALGSASVITEARDRVLRRAKPTPDDGDPG